MECKSANLCWWYLDWEISNTYRCKLEHVPVLEDVPWSSIYPHDLRWRIGVCRTGETDGANIVLQHFAGHTWYTHHGSIYEHNCRNHAQDNLVNCQTFTIIIHSSNTQKKMFIRVQGFLTKTLFQVIFSCKVDSCWYLDYHYYLHRTSIVTCCECSWLSA